MATLAEDAGWDAVFLEDYLVYQGRSDLPTFDPWICLSAIAMTTRSIRLGITVTPVPIRKPWELAAQAVSVDHVSGGRLILGVGLGDGSVPALRTGAAPVNVRTRAELLDESLTIIDALWTGKPLQHSGKHYVVDGLRLAATPVQQPRIPIWVGGDLLIPGVRRRVSRWDGACVYKGPPGDSQPVTPGDIRDLRDFVNHRPGGADGFDIKVSSSSADPQRLAEFADAGATWCTHWIPPGTVAETRAIIAAGPNGVEN